MTSPRKSMQKKSRKSLVKAKDESVKVAIRIRPLGSNSSNENPVRAFRASNNLVVEDVKSTTVGRKKDTEHSYDNVFGEEIDTTQIYSDLVQDIVSSVSKDGLNGTIFTYGQTSSGKTFTMQGAGNTEGLIQFSARDIFESIQQSEANVESVIKVSYVEIYNEELRDLLTDNKRKSEPSSLVIREGKKGTITVENLKEVAVRSLDQLMQVFRVGEANKSVGSTKMNDRSSRSHAILKLTIEKKTTFNGPLSDLGDEKENNELASPKSNTFVVKTTSTLNLVDLAGSESVRLTGATGMQKKEGGMINQSLLTLSKVLMSLGQKNPGHVNYRDSKLTRILKPSLSGNARMAVICCISPSDNYIDETRSTLQFASRAKLVKTHAVTNDIVESDADLVAKLRLELEQSRAANESLKAQMIELKSNGTKSSTTPDEDVRRELDNLRRFLFDESQRSGDENLASDSKFFTDQDIISSNKKIYLHSAAKDDSCRPQSENGDDLLRIALADKAKQVKELQEELAGRKSTKKQEHSRFSISAYQDIDNYKSQNEELQAKLANANNLISSLGKQIDELSTHKNDALDWIEELFSKSELKDKQISKAKIERDEALSQCKSLASDLAKTKQLLDFTIGEKEDAESRMKAMRSEVDALKYCLSSGASAADGAKLLKESIVNLERDKSDLMVQNEELRKKICDDKNKINELKQKCHMLQSNKGASNIDNIQVAELNELNEELEKQLKELADQLKSQEAAHSIYQEEKKSLLERVEFAENELSSVRSTLKTKLEELDDMAFSLESERKSKVKELADLQKQVQASCVDHGDVEELVDQLVAAQKALANSKSLLTTKSKALDDALNMHECEKKRMNDEIERLRNRSSELEVLVSPDDTYDAQYIKEENAALVSEVSYLKRQAVFKKQETDDELRLLRTQLQSAKQTIADCDNEMMMKEKLFKQKQTESQDALRQLEKARQQVKVSQKENEALTKRDKELRASVSRVRELVDNLASENANLKEKLDSYKRKISDCENRGRELDHLFRSAMTERDTAVKETKASKTALHQFKETTKKMRTDFESLKEAKYTVDLERENMKLKLDKMAADFEADYETLRHKLDVVTKEKAELENQLIMLEASKASIEHNADRILERDNVLSTQHDMLVAQLKKARRERGESQDEIHQLTRRLDFLKNEIERLAHDNAALMEAVKFTTEDKYPEHISNKKRKMFDFVPGEL